MERPSSSLVNSQVHPDCYFPIQLDITNLCNLNCSHCYHSHHKNEGAISPLDWDFIIRKYRDFLQIRGERPLVVICGGEPLLSSNLDSILDSIRYWLRSEGQRVKVLIISNGTKLASFDFSRLAGLDVTFQVSFDGPTESLHDFARGRGSFARSLAGCHAAISAGYPVNILTILSKNSLSFISEMFDLASRVGANSIGFTRLITVGNAEKKLHDGRDRPLLPSELKGAMMNIVIHSARSGIATNLDTPLFNLLSSKIGRSGKFWKSLVVDYRGNLLLSSRSRHRLGCAIRDDWVAIFESNDILTAIRDGRIEVCGQCPHFDHCGGDRNASFAMYGSFLKKDPGCWLGDVG